MDGLTESGCAQGRFQRSSRGFERRSERGRSEQTREVWKPGDDGADRLVKEPLLGCHIAA